MYYEILLHSTDICPAFTLYQPCPFRSDLGDVLHKIGCQVLRDSYSARSDLSRGIKFSIPTMLDSMLLSKFA